MATKKQLMAFYWPAWSAAKKKLIAQGLPGDDGARRQAQFDALGKDKSSKDLDNEEFAKAIGHFWAIAEPENLTRQMYWANFARQTKVFKIQQAAKDWAAAVHQTTRRRDLTAQGFIRSILEDGYGGRSLDDLNDAEIGKLLYTVSRAARNKQKAAKEAA